MWQQQSPASPDTGLQNESKLIFFIPSDVISTAGIHINYFYAFCCYIKCKKFSKFAVYSAIIISIYEKQIHYCHHLRRSAGFLRTDTGEIHREGKLL